MLALGSLKDIGTSLGPVIKFKQKPSALDATDKLSWNY